MYSLIDKLTLHSFLIFLAQSTRVSYFLTELPCFPDNKTGLILIFTSKYDTRAYFRGMYYFDISKNEVTK